MSDNKDFENKVSLVKETVLGLLKAIKTSEYGVDEIKNVDIYINNE